MPLSPGRMSPWMTEARAPCRPYRSWRCVARWSRWTFAPERRHLRPHRRFSGRRAP
ncbi:Hypothetical protein CAP_3896 [Chondromyces apiculatus DSM 436]|uniref:Uncharacterized protein n=1 Tax=Chondromyces apiculatus DSM 436 TaxID=1192034 RepID=A0A017T7T4_9BACT|nr:Hypothetical protein CAP_3896 [Chondromyces apiculatus DSM 436]